MKKVFYFTAFMLCIVAGVSLTCFAQPTKNHVITEIDGDVVIDWYSESETLTPFDEGWGEGFCEGWKDVRIHGVLIHHGLLVLIGIVEIHIDVDITVGLSMEAVKLKDIQTVVNNIILN